MAGRGKPQIQRRRNATSIDIGAYFVRITANPMAT
jgi:hypothetical protein